MEHVIQLGIKLAERAPRQKWYREMMSSTVTERGEA